MDVNRLCMGCMNEVDINQEICPKCGYKHGIQNSARGLQPQTILNGKYLVGKVIGEGGFGITYIAYDLVLNNRIAIKEYFPSELVTRDTSNGIQTSLTVLTGSKEEQYKKGIDRFVREAGNLAKFNNLPGIVSVKEFFYENNTAYMVMEYIDGVTLSKYLDDNGGKLPYSKVLEMMSPVMDSLEKVHEAGIIHRDISPDNIMVAKDGSMKLIDFGAARLVDNNDEKSLTVILKHGYAPEEQYHPDGKQGPWTDVYALAATMYKMITGIVPQESTDRVLNKDRLKSANKIINDVPKRISDALDHGLAVNGSERPLKVSDFKVELKTGRRNKPVLYIGIVAVILVLIAVVGMLFSNRNGRVAMFKTDDSDGNAIEQSLQTGENQDASVTSEELPKEKPESELVSMIEEASNQRVVISEYEDFDEDGYKELYSLTVPKNNEGDMSGESGQIWYADVEEAIRVVDTGVSSEYVYTDSSLYGLLHFGETTHFYVVSNSEHDEAETLSFGVVDGAPKMIYQGYAQFQNTEEGVFLENQFFYNNQTSQNQQGRCQVIYLDGQYLGCGLSPMSWTQFNSISGMAEEFEKAVNRINERYKDYPFLLYENIYYCADDCIYINTICCRSEIDYEEITDSWNRDKKLEEIDYVRCTISFSRNKDRFLFKEISEITPSSTTFLPIFYKTEDFWNLDIDTKNMSDNEAQEALMNQLALHFQMQDEELTEFWGNASDSVIGDFDNDGNREVFAFFNSGTANWNTIIGTYCISDNGIVTLSQDKAFDSYADSIEEYTFGKKHMCGYSVINQLDADTFVYEPCTGGVIRYDQLWAVREGESSYYKTSLTMATTDEGITLNPYWDVVYNQMTGKIECGDINQSADSFIDSATIWFVDGRFVECASINIDEKSFLNLDGAQEIIDNIANYAVEALKDNRANNFSEATSLYDFGIESILYCADGYIYINYLPISNQSRYGDIYTEGYVETFPSVVLKVELKENEVQISDVYPAYKMKRLTSFQPYYPQDNLFDIAVVSSDDNSIGQKQDDAVKETTSGEISGGDTIIVHVIVDDHYEFSYGEGRAIILQLDKPVNLHYFDMEGEEAVWEGFSDNLFVISDDAASGGWDQYNGKTIKCRINQFMEAATGGMIADVSEIIDVVG